MTTVGQDAARVAELDDYRVLRRPPRSELAALVELAAQLAGVPMAALNLFTGTEQHPVVTRGFDAAVGAREDSMCSVLLDLRGPVVVPDASQDERFEDNPDVDGTVGDVRFYAAQQIVTPRGVTLGTLCVFDTVPHEMSEEQVGSLRSLADRVVDLLELELRTRTLGETVAELEAAQTELRRSDEQLTAFAGQVGHHLLNRLTAVSTAVRMIDEAVERQEPSSLGAEVGWLAKRALGGADRMQSLVDDLLAFALVGGGRARVRVQLAAVVDDVLADLEVALLGATVAVGVLPTVTGDPVQLRAVLRNLLANAAELTRPGESADIVVTGSRSARGWRVEVSDHGPRIAEEDREWVLERLASVDSVVAGTSTGLTTSRRVVEAHGGRIGLAESPWGGTTAWFELPD